MKTRNKVKAPRPIRIYGKLAEPIDKILHRLWRNGLIIDDKSQAEMALRSIGYFRLLVFMRFFQNKEKRFLPGAKFSHIVKLYDFDRQARLLTLNAIEKLEVAIRAAISNPLSELYGPHWYLDKCHFKNDIAHHGVLAKVIFSAGIKKGQALAHYFDTYASPQLPPIWLVCEKLSFGALSRLFSELVIDRKKVVGRYTWRYPENLLESWFQSLTDLRNICAHQERLWNNPIATCQPMAHREHKADFAPPTSFYSRAVVIQLLLKDIGLDHWWRAELLRLLASCPYVRPKQHLGFPEKWEARACWS